MLLCDVCMSMSPSSDDDQFNDEKNILLSTLQQLEPPPGMEHLNDEHEERSKGEGEGGREMGACTTTSLCVAWCHAHVTRSC